MRWMLETEAPTVVVGSDVPAPAAAVPRFEEIAELGRGGMGRVFEARDHLLGRIVAVKQALSDDAGVQARFAREMLIAARLQHPNLLPVLDAGRDDHGRPFFVMNRVEGRSLDAAIGQAATPRARLAFVRDVAAIVRAVAYAHARGIVHRDIKPANILVGRFGEALLIDWGIARLLDEPDVATPDATASELTRAGAAMGTPGFMPPEQARGEPAGRASDVYALGATLYFVLSGARPFDEHAPTESVARAAIDESPAFTFASEVPRDLVAIVKRAMSTQPTARYPDAGALAIDLDAFLAGQLVAAHAYTVRERLARWIRKHRIAVAVGATAAVAVVIVAVLAIVNVLAARGAAVTARDAAEARLGDLLENLALSDPDVALARLAELPATSPVWRRARGAIATAIHAGGGRGLSLGTPFARPLARPDGRELVVIEPGWRALRFIDPALTGATTVLPLDTEVDHVQWLDDHTLLAVTKDHRLLRIDRATLGTTRLEIGTPSTLELVEGAPLAIADRALVTLDGRVLHAGVQYAMRVTGATLCMTAAGLVAVTDAGAAIAVATDAQAIGAHPRGDRFAFATASTIVELAWSDGRVRERARWALPAAVRLFYSGDELLAMAGGEVHALAAGVEARRVPISRPPTVVAWQPSGAYGALGSELAWVTSRGSVSVFRSRAELQYITVAGDFVVALDRAGTLRSWRRPLITKPVAPSAKIVGVGKDQILVASRDALERVTISTLASDPLDPQYADRTFRCEREGRWLASAPDAWFVPSALVEVGGGAAQAFDAQVKAVIGCADDDVVVMTAAAIEVRDRRSLARVIARIPTDEARGAAFANGRILVHGADGAMALFDRAGAPLRSLAVGDARAFALDATGTVLYEHDGQLVRWSGGAPRTVATGVPHLDVRAIGTGDGSFFVLGGTTTLASTIDVSLLIDERGAVTRWTNADARPQWIDGRILTARAGGTVTISDPRDGSTLQLAMPGFLDDIVLTETAVIAVSRALGLLRVTRLDDIPRDPAALRAWLHEASNAKVAPGATFATFPAPN